MSVGADPPPSALEALGDRLQRLTQAVDAIAVYVASSAGKK